MLEGEGWKVDEIIEVINDYGEKIGVQRDIEIDHAKNHRKRAEFLGKLERRSQDEWVL